MATYAIPFRMQEIVIKLWLNEKADDWSIEINGQRSHHLSREIMEDLVELSMIVAEVSLADAATRESH